MLKKQIVPTVALVLLVVSVAFAAGLEKKVVYRQQIDEFGNINVQKVTQVWEGGKLLSSSNHRHVVHPGDSTTNEDTVTKAIATAVHTTEVIAVYEVAKAAAAAELEDK